MPVYSPEIASEICERLANGESLRSICASDRSKFPTEMAVRKWAIEDYNGFSSQYASAREMGMDSLAEEALSVARDGSRDYIETEDGLKLNLEHVQRSRLICDQIKWYTSKLAPKRYGDRTQTAFTDTAGNDVQPVLNIVGVPPPKV